MGAAKPADQAAANAKAAEAVAVANDAAAKATVVQNKASAAAATAKDEVTKAMGKLKTEQMHTVAQISNKLNAISQQPLQTWGGDAATRYAQTIADLDHKTDQAVKHAIKELSSAQVSL